jgi:flagellar biogenesis protein FliO
MDFKHQYKHTQAIRLVSEIQYSSRSTNQDLHHQAPSKDSFKSVLKKALEKESQNKR